MLYSAYMGILLYTRIEGGGGTSDGISVFAGILLYTHDDWGIVGVYWWHVLQLCS